MTASSIVFFNTEESVNDIFSANKVIIETHVASKRYYNYPDSVIKKTKIIVHYRWGRVYFRRNISNGA